MLLMHYTIIITQIPQSQCEHLGCLYQKLQKIALKNLQLLSDKALNLE